MIPGHKSGPKNDEEVPLEARTSINHNLPPVGILPHARGLGNGFLGETNDAADVVSIYVAIN